jgi:hypothetical protein
MDCDRKEPVGLKAPDDESEMLPEDTARLSLERSELQPDADGARDSDTAEENILLQSKDMDYPSSITRVGDVESRQSPASDSLVDAIKTRKESEVDRLGGIDSKCDENEGIEEKLTEDTKELHSDVNKTAADGRVISGKDSHEDYRELNMKEKHEAENVSDEEKKDLEELKEKKEIEVVNRMGTKTEEISNKQNNETEKVIELTDEEKKVLSDKQKEGVGEQSNEKNSVVIEPENGGHKPKGELEATESAGKENDEAPKNKSKQETGMTATKAGSDEREMNVDDPDAYPEQINFVDVNAPNCDSPMVIDDDDGDDEIVMIERKKGTSQKAKTDDNQKGKKGSTNRDSSPEVVLQEKSCSRRQEIVIDLDDDDGEDDDIEIESVKKKKKNNSDVPRGACCCNVECSAPSQDLSSAPVFILTYYGRKYRKGKPEKVCPLCFEVAMQHQEVSMYAVFFSFPPTIQFFGIVSHGWMHDMVGIAQPV